MSRFEKFQNIRVLNAENEPLYGQIFVQDCIINFEDGFISNWYNENEGETKGSAINCIDGHTEYWENGVIHNIKNDPAVSSADGVEFWENGIYLGEVNYNNKDLLMQKGQDAELAFARYLNKSKIPFMHLCQAGKESYSKILMNKNIKRPDYLIFIDKKPLFIEVKATSCYTICKKELERINALKNEFQINVIFAVTNINDEEFDDYYFMSLDNLNNYIKIIRNEEDTNRWHFYFYSKSLLKNEIISNNINNEELESIYHTEKQNNKYRTDKNYFSDILESYFKENNYKME